MDDEYSEGGKGRPPELYVVQENSLARQGSVSQFKEC